MYRPTSLAFVVDDMTILIMYTMLSPAPLLGDIIELLLLDREVSAG